MKQLNITYYFGQIRPKFRGDLVLFMDLTEEGKQSFKSVRLDSENMLLHTGGLHSPSRTYIGVNEQVEPLLTERWEKGNLRSMHALDIGIVKDEIIERRCNEIETLEMAAIQAAINTGK